MKFLCLSFLLLAITLKLNQAQDTQVSVTVNYDYAEEKVKVFYVKRALIIRCELSVQGEYEIQWVKDGLPVAEINDLKNRYTLSGPEFRIATTDEVDAGMYECIFPQIANVRASIEAIANVQVRLPSDTNVVEGETLRLVCGVAGTKPLISWLVGGNESYAESRDRIKLEEDQGIPNVKLILEGVTMDDRTTYTCIARNRASQLLGENAESTTLVRVRSKYAAMWPFLGICVEVAVLCLVIWICEKRRLKRMEDESDDDMETHIKNGNSNVRQRH